MTTTNKNIVTTAHAEKTVSNYVPFGGQAVDLGEEASVPVPEFPMIQYATGLKAQRVKKDRDGYDDINPVTGVVKMENIAFAGFFTEIGKDPELDEVMRAKDIPCVYILHGGGEVKKHWALEEASVFLVAKGLPGNSREEGQSGVVFTWRKKDKGKDENVKESVISVQVLIRDLLPLYAKPFVLTMKSTQSTDLHKAMTYQYKVLRRAHEELQRVHRDMALPLWAYSLPMGPSGNPESRGGGEKKSVIIPLVALVPKEVTTEYLYRNEIPEDYIEILREAAEGSVGWAMASHQRIINNDESTEPWAQGQAAAVPTEDTSFSS